jgi:Glycosyl hydrolases family 16
MSHLMKRLITALVAVIVAVAWAGAATAGAQTQEDADFSGGTHDGTQVVPLGDLALSPVTDIVADFDGTTLPSGWEVVPWETGGSATVGDGLLTVDGARANTTSLYDAGRLLEFAATFTADPFQHVGFGTDFNDGPWAMFSTGGGSLPVGLYARTLAPGGTAMNTPIADVDPLEEHEYSIEWTPTEVVYYVDGEEVAVHEVAISAQMRPIVSDFSAGGGSVVVEYLDLYPVTDTYPAEGTFTSRVFDAGNASATWQTLTAAVDAPEGTGVSFEVRTGTTPTPDATWTDWQPVGAGGALPGPAGRRYLQYRATLTTTDTSFTPFVESVTLENDADTTAPAATIGGVTVTGNAATVTFSSTAGDVARFECSLDGAVFQTCTSPRELTGLSDGSHTVWVRAIDQAGNEGATVQSTFAIDTTAPAATIGDVTVTGTTARVTFSSEAGARFECSLDGGTFQACTSPRDFTGLAAGSHTVRVRAIDQAGNVGAAAERSFSITAPQPPDTTAPKVRPKPRTVSVSNRGRFRVRVTCPSTETRYRIAIRIRYRGKTVASKAVAVLGGRTTTVTLRLKPSARVALNSNGRLRVTAITTARDAAGNQATTQTRMRLRD